MSAWVRPLWVSPPPDWERRLQACLDRAASSRAEVCFRADDAAAGGAKFQRMLDVFASWEFPLDLAVVPAWLTRPRAATLLLAARSELFSLHQHGYRHANHEPEGKQCEFGPSRPAGAKRRDLARGKKRLEELLGDRFRPVFTPPWNRVDAETLGILKELGFEAVSRYEGDGPEPPPGLARRDVNVDLHTRKQAPEAALAGLLDELESALASERAGIMLHHQTMNEPAFDFLDRLLHGLSRLEGIRAVSMA